MLLLLPLLALAEPLPDGPTTALPHRAWDIAHLHLAVRVDPEAGTVSGTTRHTVSPLGARDPWFVLHQRGLDIRAVRVGGQPARHLVEPDQLRVMLPEGPGPFEVEVDYAAKPEAGIYFRSPSRGDRIVEAWSQGEDEDHRYWFPSWDHPSDRFSFSADLTAPSGLVALSNGTLQGQKPADPGWTTSSWKLDQEIVNYLVAVTVGDYEAHRQKAHTDVETWVPRGMGAEAVKRSSADLPEMMAWMGEWTGLAYPYPSYRHVFVQRFLYSGMENTSLVVLSDELLRDDEGDPDARSASVQLHELAHHWFGDWLTCYGWRELWLNEGFASYSEMRWAEHKHGAEAVAAWQIDYRDWGLGDPDRPMAARGWSKHDERPNTGVYVRGSTVLRGLEHMLGRPTMDAAIREYVRRHGDSLVETDDWRRVLEDVSGRPLGWHFDRVVTGTAFPKIASSWAWDNGALTLRFEQIADGVAELPVEVEIGTAEGVIRRNLWLDAGTSRVVLELAEAPRWVAVDPDAVGLVYWAPDQTPAAWAAQARHSPTPTARVLAFDALANEAAAEAVPALAAAVSDAELHPAMRARAATRLGRHASPEAVDALISALATDQPRKLRLAAATALAEVPGEAPVRAALRARLDDADPLVRANALRSLGKHEREAALPAARAWLAKPDTTSIADLHIAALEVLGGADLAKDDALVLKALAPKTAKNAREAALRAAESRLERRVAADAEAAKKLRAGLQEALLPWLDEADIELRWAAVEALGRIGDLSVEPRLRALSRATAIPELAVDAGEAALAVRARGEALPFAPAPEAPPVLDADLESLREELDRLKARLDALSARP